MSMKSTQQKTTAPETATVATFRNLYTRVLLGLQAQEHQVLGVTSAIDGEGKTTIAFGLAAGVAQDGALLGFGRESDTAVLVECNVGAGPQDPRLNLHAGPGLVQVLRGESTIEKAIQRTGVDRLSIMTLGEPAHSFPLAIRTPALADVMAQLRGRFGLVVLDLPSVLNSTDTQILARLADQIVMVVRAGVTPAKLVRQAVDELGEERMLGVVLNDSRSDLPAWLDNRI
jgi:Mrp family chromosome partitioning ATPase